MKALKIILLSILLVNTSCTIHKRLNYSDQQSSFPLIKEINTLGHQSSTRKYIVLTDQSRYKASKIIVYSDSTYFYLEDVSQGVDTSDFFLPGTFKNKYERISNSKIKLIQIEDPITNSPEIIFGKVLIGTAGGFALGYLIGYTLTTEEENTSSRNESARKIAAIGGLLGAVSGYPVLKQVEVNKKTNYKFIGVKKDTLNHNEF